MREDAGHCRYKEDMNVTLTVVFEEVPAADEGGFVAYVEEPPGAITEGDTLEEARENLRKAIALLLEANHRLTRKTKPLEKDYPRED